MELWLEGRTGWLHHFSDQPKGSVRTFGQSDWQLASLLIHFPMICQNEEIVLADLSRSAVSDSVAETWRDGRHIARTAGNSCWIYESWSHNNAFISREEKRHLKNYFKVWENDIRADVRSRVNHLTVLHRRWRLLSFGGKCFVFVNFLNIYKYSLKVRRGVMLCHLFSRHARSPGPPNKSSSLFLLRGKRLCHSWVLGVTSCWCWRRRKFDVCVSLRQVKAPVMKAGRC